MSVNPTKLKAKKANSLSKIAATWFSFNRDRRSSCSNTDSPSCVVIPEEVIQSTVAAHASIVRFLASAELAHEVALSSYYLSNDKLRRFVQYYEDTEQLEQAEQLKQLI
ncbi:hypothetical protein D9611_007136 [Ephemerocybe angulata]|uniref:Uncharacterized protein n=1 Tax=Ephemerocybe angulata TaxID=980116 RepID=A0A8H5EWP3_9AGAR|nr:hypothetical protein D9611_007136 [Tulosesus angulatus]